MQARQRSDAASKALLGLLIHSGAGEHLNLLCHPHEVAGNHSAPEAIRISSSNGSHCTHADAKCIWGLTSPFAPLDGLAVGAASLGTSHTLKLTVALAMLLHKAPVAVGLVTCFLHAKWSWPRQRRGLLLFALASPVAAGLTYLCIGLTPQLASPSAIALCVVFSGGTFLYAACLHILPEVLGRQGHLEGRQLCAIMGGMGLPLALSFLHPH